MSADLVQRPELDQLLARVLQRGTWLGSTVIALGMALPIIGGSGASSAMMCTRIVTVGIALIIILPVLRVLLMLIVFVRERDFRFSAIATLVLAIIVLGSVLGGHTHAVIPQLERLGAVPFHFGVQSKKGPCAEIKDNRTLRDPNLRHRNSASPTVFRSERPQGA